MSDKMVEVAMGIIINAGDARTCATDAMEAELRGDRAGADAKLKEADEAIKKAHNAQTDVIQDDVGVKHQIHSGSSGARPAARHR